MAGTIAFSGLSGIDTSSWINALVSVKQTTLTSLQAQQALKKTLLSTVNSIKSFFTSFQNSLQKVTDAQFGISSMDLFMQNLAKSSNTNIVTATATTDAARQSYDVLVSQLATSTKATSGYTQTVTKDVALETTLGTLGVTAGTITVNNQSFSVSKDDTLSTLITKFKNVGVTASLDTDTSKFTVSANVAGINDGTTGLKTALKLSDTAISGVTSGTLVYADTSTALSKLGLTGGAVTMNAAGGATSNYTITKNATNYSIQKGAGPATTITTLGDLFNYMTGTVGADSATIDSNGNISIQGAVITPVDGGSNILSALNLTQVVDRTVMKSGTLQVTNTHVADSSTTMAQLGIAGTTTFIINGVSNNITSDKTIGNLETILNGAGVGASMSVDSNGVISINTNGATLGGTVLTSLGLNPTTEGTTIQSSAHTITNYATGSTLLSSLGVTNAMVYTAYKSDGTALTGTLNNNGSLTVDDFITKLKSNGLDASFDSTTGKITINDGYISGTVATKLGMATSSSMVTEKATGTTTLSQIGATTDTNTLTINGGTASTYAKTTNLTTIMNAITSAGGTATLDSDGKLTVTGVTLGGTIPTLLGLGATQQGTSITSGALSYVTNTSSTSTSGLTQTVSTNITAATQLGYINSSMTDYSLSINGTNKTYNANTALSTVAADIASAGGTMTINDDSTITVTGVNLSGGLVNKLELNATSQGTVVSSNTAISVGGLTEVADANTTLSQLGLTGSYGLTLGDDDISYTYSGSSTIGTILDDINGYGASDAAKIDNTGAITINGIHAVGTLLTALGLASTGQKSTSISSGTLTYVSSESSTGTGLVSSNSSSAITINSTVAQASSGTSSTLNINNVSSLTSGETYLISDVAGLNKLRTLSSQSSGVNFVLGSNIDASSIAGTISNFAGTLDGNGYTITVGNTGLFNNTSGATIENLNLTLNKTSSSTYSGGLTNSSTNSTFKNITITGSITNTYTTGQTGSLIGSDLGGTTISDISSTANVSGYYNTSSSTLSVVGGIVGASSLTFNASNVYYSGYVTGGQVGGILGGGAGTITNATADAILTGISAVGGIVGYLWIDGIISNCQSIGTATGTNTYAGGASSVGGIIGQTYTPGQTKISDCYSSVVASATSPSNQYSGKILGAVNAGSPGLVDVSEVYSSASSVGSNSGQTSDQYIGTNSSSTLTYDQNGPNDLTNSAIQAIAVAAAPTSSSVSGYNLVINGTTKNYSKTTTLATIQSDIEAAGGTMTVASDGSISISGVRLSGSMIDVLGLSATGQNTTINGATSLSSSASVMGTLRLIKNGSEVTDLTYSSGSTVSDVLRDLNALGVSASVSSGHLVASSDDESFVLSGDVGSYLVGGGSTINYNSSFTSGAKSLSSTSAASTSSTLASLGVTDGKINIKDASGTITGSIDVSGTMTVAQLQSSLSNYGFTLSSSSGTFSISTSSGNTLVDSTSNLLSSLKLTSWTPTTSNVVSSTTMAQLGYSDGTTMSVLVDNSSLYQLSFGANDSIQDVENTLATFGVRASVDASGHFIANSILHTFTLTGDLAKTLTSGTSGYVNSDKSYVSPKEQYTTAVTPLATSSTIASLLGSNTGGTLRLAINGSQIVSLTYGATDTVSDVIKDLSDLGITASVSGSGVFSAKSTGETFVLSGEVGQALRGVSGTTTDIDEGYQSGTLQEVHTSTATNSSVLKDLGIKSGQIYVMDSNNNVVNSIDISDSMTVQQVKATLLSNGFSMGIDGTGKVTVSSTNGYTLTDGSSDMVSKMNLATWANTTAKVTTGTTLSQLGFKDGSNLNILIDGTNSNSLSFGASDTVQSVINSLGALGITASVDSNGKFAASSTGHTFVMSGDLAATLTKGTAGYVNSDKGYTADVTYQGPYATDTSSQLKYTNALSMSTTVGSMGFSDGGTIRLIEDGDTPYTLSFLATDTLQDVTDTLAAYGITGSVDSNGKYTATSISHSFTMGSALGTYLTNGGTYTDKATGYVSSPETYNTTDNINTTTKLSSLGVANGYLNIMKDGSVVSNNIQIDDTTTVGQLFSAMNVYGLTGQVLTDTNGKTYMQITSADGSYLADGTSNVVSKLGLNNINMGDYTGTLEYWDSSASSGLITNDMLLSSFDKNGYVSTGSLLFTTGSGDTAQNHIVNIASDDTVGTFLTKMQNEGVNAVLDNGVIKISNSVNGVTFTGGTSGVMNTLGLTSGNLYTYASSSSAVTYQGKDSSSVANYADGGTLLSTVNTTDGTLSLYVDGVKCSVNVSASDSFSALFGKIASSVAAKTGLTIKAGFLDTNGNIVTNPAAAQNTGVIAMQIADGHTLVVGASNDTSNFSTIANLSQDSTTEVKGTRALYKVNTSSTLTSSGLFKAGDITTGTFSIGDASFTIDANTTLSGLMTQINKSDKSYASAYWDTLSGTMVIQSTITGASLINIEAGTSNFTDIMGLTKNDSGTETLNTDSQTLGNNAIVEINGTKVISTSNTITSDISKVKGLTLNLKGLSTGTTPTTVTVSQDTDSIVSAVSDLVDSYNSMMDELDKALGTSSSSSSSSTTTATPTTSTGLETDTMLKMLKNSLKSMMTSSVAGLTTYKNLAAVGISTGDASDSISTDVTSLVFDKEKFLAALKANPDDVKKLLVGTSSSQGIFLQEYNKVQSTLKSTGYISTLVNSTTKSISTLDTKISDMSDALTKYRAQLEKKFGAMDSIISKMQNSYSSLLGSSASSGLSSSS